MDIIPSLYLFTEVSATIGSGHLMRCTALYDAFKQKGAQCRLVIFGEEEMCRKIGDYQFIFCDWINERLPFTLQADSIVVIDSYLAPLSVYKKIASLASEMLYFDDTNRLNYPVGTLLNGAIYTDGIDYKFSNQLHYLLGPQYAILRQPFLVCNRYKKENSKIENILITLGASDLSREIEPIIYFFEKHYPEILLHILVTNNKLTEKCYSNPKHRFYHNLSAKEMIILFSKCDIAVTAAGQTSLELAYMGVPQIVVQVAENQKFNICGLMYYGLISDFLDINNLNFTALDAAFKRLIPITEREKIAQLSRAIIDGRGVDRVIKHLLHIYMLKRIRIRTVQSNDLIPLFELVNEPNVRDNSFSTNMISFSEHSQWFSQSLNDQNREILIATINDCFVAQIRFDKKNENKSIISIAIVEELRGLKLGAEILMQSIDYYKDKEGERTIVAEVKESNIPSQKMFLHVGFYLIKNNNGVLFYELK